MKITTFSIKRPITILMAIITILMFGFVSFFKLNVDLLPSFNLPMIMIQTSYPGAGPEEIESIVTSPFESILLTTSNVKNVNSVSSEGSSMITLEFEDGTDMDFASIEVREKIDMVKGMLPKEVSSPMIMKLNPNMMPIMQIGVNIDGKDLSELSSWANDTLAPSLERVNGVAKVDLYGSRYQEVKVVIDPDKLATFGINTAQLTQLISSENINIPGGSIKEGDFDILVRASNSFKSIDDVKKIKIPTPTGDVVKLDDIAKITLGSDKSSGIVKINGRDSLLLTVQKESNSNTTKVSEGVHKAFDTLVKTDKNLEITPVFDQAQYINLSLNAVKTNALVGAILAVLIILLFLKDVKTTIIMALSIPISIIATFVCMYFSNMTLNMISLGGLALGIGMLVDNSIVVIENIYRLKKMGVPSYDAAITGTKEVASAITASTLTSVSVFIPILFVEGIAATIFKEMALTVTYALLCSLLIAFTLVPLLASRLITNDAFNKENKLVEKIKKKYYSVLEWSLDNKKYVVSILVMSIIFGALSLTQIGFEFFPASDQGIVYVDVITPKGTNMDVVEKTVSDISKKIVDVKEVKTTASSISDSNSTSSIMLVLKDNKDRKKTDIEISDEIRKKIGSTSECKVNVKGASSMMSMSSASPITISISGFEFDTLEKISNDVIKKVKDVDGTVDVKLAEEKNAQEIKVRVDKEKAAKHGITSQMVSQTIKQQLQNSKVSSFTVEGKNYDVNIYANEGKSSTLSDLLNINILSPTNEKVPLEEIASLERDEGYHNINRMNQARTMIVNANVKDKSLGNVVKEIEKSLKGYKLPNGYTISFGGEVEQMNESFSSLFLALVLAIALVYMVMASQFESLINPLIIMVTVPLALVGAVLSLFIFNIPLSMPAMIGFVILTGIIVNNGIVLVDLINRLKMEGETTRSAILKAGPTRLQPILMTSLTTILGLLPMTLGIGEGSEIQLPLAVAVSGGLIFSTLLTLVVVPVIYTILDGFKKKFRKKFKKS